MSLGAVQQTMPTPREQPEPAIAARLRGGDHGALDRVIDAEYEPCVRAAMRFTGRDRSFAEDAAQDAFLRLVRRPPRVRDETHLARWLRTAVRSACIDRLRAEARRARRELESSSRTKQAEAATVDDATLAHLREQLGALGEDERDLLIRRFTSDASHTDLASALGLNRETLRGRLTRSLTRLADGWRTTP